jgi:dTDP-4-dehydrorhamnose reductase
MGVYGHESKRKNFLYQIYDSLKIGKAIQVPNDQFGNCTYAVDLADGILQLIESGMYGIWNIAGPKPMEKRSDLARTIALLYGLNKKLIIDAPTSEINQEASRPKYAGLSIEKTACKFGFSPKTLEDIMPLKL